MPRCVIFLPLWVKNKGTDRCFKKSDVLKAVILSHLLRCSSPLVFVVSQHIIVQLDPDILKKEDGESVSERS